MTKMTRCFSIHVSVVKTHGSTVYYSYVLLELYPGAVIRIEFTWFVLDCKSYLKCHAVDKTG